jgi:hypothetical protein
MLKPKCGDKVRARIKWYSAPQNVDGVVARIDYESPNPQVAIETDNIKCWWISVNTNLSDKEISYYGKLLKILR